MRVLLSVLVLTLAGGPAIAFTKGAILGTRRQRLVLASAVRNAFPQPGAAAGELIRSR
jgi:hypothetical protein